MKTLSYLLLILMLWGGQTVRANHYYYKQLSMQDGLPTAVRCIYRERKGAIWIGTYSGLGRFDGHELKRYTAQKDNKNTLPNNEIHQIIEDKNHHIWIITGGALARYERESDHFYIPQLDNGERIIARTACLTKQGFFLGANSKIYQYDYETDKIRLVQVLKGKQNFTITQINPWSHDVLLCSSRHTGIILVNIRTGQISKAPFNCGEEITDILIDSQKRIWITLYNNGVECYDRNGQLLAKYTTQNSGLSHNLILSIAELNGKIWLGTDGGGINVLNPQTKQVTILEHVPGDDYSLPVNSILCLYKDNYNNMWAGSIRSGLISIRKSSIKTYTDATLNSSHGLSDNTVLSLYQRPNDQHIWIGTDGGGINSFDPNTGKFKHFLSTWRDKVVSITGYSKTELMISLFAKGVFIFNTTTGHYQSLTSIDKEINSYLRFSGKAVNLYQNTPETVLLLASHIYRYTIKTKVFDLVKEEEGQHITGTLLPIETKAEKTYLHDLKSIYILDHQKNELETICTVGGDTIINSVSADQNGTFWIGTNYGLSAYTPTTREFKNIPTGLFSEVRSVICDHKGKLWIGVDGMLFAWMIKEQKFIIFGESDGVIRNEYLQKPRLLSNNGDVYMGGVKGLLHIGHTLHIDSSETPTLQLTDVSLNGESMNKELTKEHPMISIPWNNTAITIRVMAEEKDILRKKRYRYQIVGLSDQYIESYQPELVIRSLRPGTYQIMASCSTRDGDWTASEQVLTILVLPPWYQSWWFILVCILLISYAIIQVFLFTLKRKEEKMKWAIQIHEQKVYEEKVRFLINISHELRTPLTLIHSPLQRILKSLSDNDSHYTALKNIYKQTLRMKEIINMVLDLRKLEIKESKLQVSPQLLNDWIRTTAGNFVHESEAQNIRIDYQLDEQVGTVSFNADKCEIILNNLLINALKHSTEGSTITIRSSIITDRQSVRIAVSDQGCGLAGVDVDKLFTRFYQGSNEQNGSGIGLSYAKILAELHGGSIGATNNVDAGATFFFELPLVTTAEIISCPPKAYLNELITDKSAMEEPQANAFPTNSYTVLIVDDNADLINFLREALETDFKQILTAKDGVDALNVIKREQPDIIISDVMMPHMNGYELCKQIKENIEISHIPILLLTARDDEQSEIQGYKTGADAYLTKPFEIDVLLELIRSRLKNREYTRMRYLHAGFIPPPEESTISQTDENFMLKINKIITTNLSSPTLDVTLICKEIGMSRASLYNKIKALANMGVNDYINKYRMEKAMVLIKQTELSIAEIAEQVGFSTSRYFSTAFKQHTGQTPTQYKEKNKKPTNINTSH